MKSVFFVFCSILVVMSNSKDAHAASAFARWALQCDLEMVQVDLHSSNKMSKDNSQTAVMPLVSTPTPNEYFAESDIIRFAHNCDKQHSKACSSTQSLHGVVLHAFVNPQGAIDIAGQILQFTDNQTSVGEPVAAIKMTYSSTLDFLAPNAPEQTISYYNPYVIDPRLTSIADLVAGNFLQDLELIRVTVSHCIQVPLDTRSPSRPYRN